MKEKSDIPPVMITVANRTETAARVEYAFKHKQIHIDELCEPEYLRHIDSKTLEMAEATNLSADDISTNSDTEDNSEGKRKLSKKEEAAILREEVNTVGQVGKRGEQIRNVISVGMLKRGGMQKQ